MKRLILPLCLLLGLTLLGYREYRLEPDGHLHLYFLDVGQGDSALIVTPSGKQILIDGGPDITTLEHLGRYLPFFDRRIDLLIMSHPQLDHMASFPDIAERYHVSTLILSGADYPLPRYHRLLADLQGRGIHPFIMDHEQTVDLGDGVALELLWPQQNLVGKEVTNINNTSVTVRLSYAGHSALFTGDMEAATERELVSRKLPLQSEILKVPHHGSLTSSSTGFLLAVAPKLAVISVGKYNTYGHPRKQILERLTHFGIPYKRTDLDGTVEILW